MPNTQTGRGNRITSWATPGTASPAVPTSVRGIHSIPAILSPPRSERDPLEEGVRRGLNLLTAVVGLVLALPVMLLIAVLVKLTSRGPVIYTQPRVGMDRRRRNTGRRTDESPHSAGFPLVVGLGDGNGDRPRAVHRNGDSPERRRRDLGGEVFNIYKFRTMRAEADDGEQRWASPDDDRVTPVGRFLRRHRLDELPQLFNVLKGDMNVVGPRPEQPRLFEQISQEIPRYRRRQRVLPGITGWAQINHKYDQTMEDVRKKLDFDLDYLHGRSPVQDLRIMARTPLVMLGQEGAW